MIVSEPCFPGEWSVSACLCVRVCKTRNRALSFGSPGSAERRRSQRLSCRFPRSPSYGTLCSAAGSFVRGTDAIFVHSVESVSPALSDPLAWESGLWERLWAFLLQVLGAQGSLRLCRLVLLAVRTQPREERSEALPLCCLNL